jgi:hypothetical protein
MDWVFIECKSADDRVLLASVLVRNGYEVRLGKRLANGKKTYDYGVEYKMSGNKGCTV